MEESIMNLPDAFTHRVLDSIPTTGVDPEVPEGPHVTADAALGAVDFLQGGLRAWHRSVPSDAQVGAHQHVSGVDAAHLTTNEVVTGYCPF